MTAKDNAQGGIGQSSRQGTPNGRALFCFRLSCERVLAVYVVWSRSCAETRADREKNFPYALVWCRPADSVTAVRCLTTAECAKRSFAVLMKTAATTARR